jgi:non-ribosomal peptide synthetase component E (peptide arylation enzyme)
VYYPLTVRDFLDRAAHVYRDRVAVVDEPEQPGPSLGELTYRELAALARAQAARLDRLGIPVGGRVAVSAAVISCSARSTAPRYCAASSGTASP